MLYIFEDSTMIIESGVLKGRYQAPITFTSSTVNRNHLLCSVGNTFDVISDIFIINEARFVGTATELKSALETFFDLPVEAKIYKKTIILNDAQIKALPTTPIEIVAAPGLGKFLMPLSGLIITNFDAGAYTTNADASLSINNFQTQLSSPMKTANIMASATKRIARFIFPNSYTGAGTFAGYSFSAFDSTVPNLENGNLEIQDIFAGVSNYTGGNAANTLKVIIKYTIEDL